MDGSIRLTEEQRKSLLKIVRSKSGCEVRWALIVLHSAAGKSYRWIAEASLTACDSIMLYDRPFDEEEPGDVLDPKGGIRPKRPLND